MRFQLVMCRYPYAQTALCLTVLRFLIELSRVWQCALFQYYQKLNRATAVESRRHIFDIHIYRSLGDAIDRSERLVPNLDIIHASDQSRGRCSYRNIDSRLVYNSNSPTMLVIDTQFLMSRDRFCWERYLCTCSRTMLVASMERCSMMPLNVGTGKGSDALRKNHHAQPWAEANGVLEYHSPAAGAGILRSQWSSRIVVAMLLVASNLQLSYAQ